MNKQQLELEERGFVVRPRLVDEPVLHRLEQAIRCHARSQNGRKRRGELFGMRNLLVSIPEVRDFACSSTLREVVEPILGDGAAAVRGLYFDKTPAANWRLGWHQDKAIAVKDRFNLPGYGPWSIKAGVHHVFPPLEVLAQMVTVRVHLDSCDEMSGALQVIPGTHRRAMVNESDYLSSAAEAGVTTCTVERGDAVIMRPLLAHASAKARNPSQRRVVHLEYAARPLPTPMLWNEYVPFRQQAF